MAESVASEKPQTHSIYNLNTKIATSTLFFAISVSLVSFSVLCFSFTDTKFWFFFSNAIILLVAADSGAFSSSKPKPDFYDEYLRYSRSRIAHSNMNSVPHLPEIRSRNDTQCRKEDVKERMGNVLEKSPERCIPSNVGKETVVVANGRKLKRSVTENVSRRLEDTNYLNPMSDEEQKPRVEEKLLFDEGYSRSNSEKAIVVVPNKKNLQQSGTENLNHKSDEGNDLFALSNEELNQRVEEFINRFNREMRLQEIRERSQPTEL